MQTARPKRSKRFLYERHIKIAAIVECLECVPAIIQHVSRNILVADIRRVADHDVRLFNRCTQEIFHPDTLFRWYNTHTGDALTATFDLCRIDIISSDIAVEGFNGIETKSFG